MSQKISFESFKALGAYAVEKIIKGTIKLYLQQWKSWKIRCLAQKQFRMCALYEFVSELELKL